jgi:hypothetical protein
VSALKLRCGLDLAPALLGFIAGAILLSIFDGGDVWGDVGNALLVGLISFVALIVGLFAIVVLLVLSISVYIVRGGGSED